MPGKRLNWDEVRQMSRNVDNIYVAKGKQVIHIDLRTTKREPEQLARFLLRPSGNLRSPALLRGRTLVVGFDEVTYQKILGGA